LVSGRPKHFTELVRISSYQGDERYAGTDLMKKWTSVKIALMPDGKTISLNEHDGNYSIRVDGAELMSTRRHASEEKIAELACAHIAGIPGARVLIGGLGFGFTLRSALSALAGDATVVMVEILAAVVAWNRNPSFNLAACALADPRVIVLQKDVGEVIRESPDSFDSIILDVDNGPAALSTGSNRHLYDSEGLHRARAALRPGGCVAIWSAAADPAFEKLMASAGFEVDVQRCRAHANSGGRHTLFIGRARRPGPERFSTNS
jgi:spermidine synthase